MPVRGVCDGGKHVGHGHDLHIIGKLEGSAFGITLDQVMFEFCCWFCSRHCKHWICKRVALVYTAHGSDWHELPSCRTPYMLCGSRVPDVECLEHSRTTMGKLSGRILPIQALLGAFAITSANATLHILATHCPGSVVDLCAAILYTGAELVRTSSTLDL